jgi:DNA-binding response OmpR family regulator
MPGMDGMDVLRHVRKFQPDIRIIIITAHGTIESAVEAMRLGAVDFIQKPFTPNEIRHLVQRVLDRDQIAAETAKDYETHIELAKRCIGDGKFDSAKEHVNEAIAQDASKPEAFNLKGALLEIDGQIGEALKQYRVAYHLEPTYAPARANLDRIVVQHERGPISMDDKG